MVIVITNNGDRENSVWCGVCGVCGVLALGLKCWLLEGYLTTALAGLIRDAGQWSL